MGQVKKIPKRAGTTEKSISTVLAQVAREYQLAQRADLCSI
jgi:hypothetical protein